MRESGGVYAHKGLQLQRCCFCIHFCTIKNNLPLSFLPFGFTAVCKIFLFLSMVFSLCVFYFSHSTGFITLHLFNDLNGVYGWCLECILDDGLEVSSPLHASQLGEQVCPHVAFTWYVIHLETIEIINKGVDYVIIFE